MSIQVDDVESHLKTILFQVFEMLLFMSNTFPTIV